MVGRRFAQLIFGLLLFGASLGLMVRAGLGLGPWDVLHQGIAYRTGIGIGWVVIAVSGVVLIAWVPLRQRPGAGTLLNAVLVGLALNAMLAVSPQPQALAWRCAFLLAGILLNGIATGLYIGAGLGSGPRDGLMIGMSRYGFPIWAVRAAIECSVLLAGFFLGGRVGVGTLLYAFGIGPLAHYMIPRFTINSLESPVRAPASQIA